jgi:hypothetical protein
MSTEISTRTGIPTDYRGIRHRSRLEARWAAFFRLIGWESHYEPFDLNGWIPDFVLHGKGPNSSTILKIPVEVKPVSGMDDPLFEETRRKIERSGWENDVLIVSYFLPRDQNIGPTMCRLAG